MKTRCKYQSLLAATALMAAAPFSAQAAGVLGPAQLSIVITDDNFGGLVVCGGQTPRDCASQGAASAHGQLILLPDGAFSGSGVGTVSGSPEPVILVSASLAADQLEEGGSSPQSMIADAILSYSFELTPTDGTTFAGDVVPVLASGSFSESLTTGDHSNGTESSVGLQIVDPDGNILYNMAGSGAGGSFSQGLSLQPGVQYNVFMSADAQATVSSNSEQAEYESANAALDPIFSIDSSCGCAGDFQFSFSPGVGNGAATGAVPEPATWAMMLVGFGGLGAAMRSRRTTRLADA